MIIKTYLKTIARPLVNTATPKHTYTYTTKPRPASRQLSAIKKVDKFERSDMTKK